MPALLEHPVAPSHLLPVYDQLAIEPVEGHGVWLELADGRTLLDLYGGHAVALLGYRHPRLLGTLAAQARQLFFQSNALPMTIRERAASALVRFGPAGLDQVFLVNSGAEANENALRLALRATGRRTIVALEGAFHGRTAGAGAVTWNSARWYGFPRAPFDVRFVPREDLAALDRLLATGDVAAVIAEPVQGVAGAIALSDEWLHGARAATRAAGSLLILDEVQCGMGRCGAPFVAAAVGVVPDLLTVAKGLAGGFPAAALLMTAELAAAVRPGDLGTTFGGGPLACALIEATLDALVDEDLVANAAARADYLRATCVVGPVRGVTGRGLLAGLRTSRSARAIQAELLARGILVGTSADPYVVRLLPPLILEDGQIDRLAAALAELPQ